MPSVNLINPRLKNHITLFAVSVVSLGSAVFSGPGAADRLSIVSAYICLLLLGLALLIGPMTVLRTGRLPGNLYIRRDTGIWAALMGLLHFYLANVLSMNYEYLGIYVENSALPPSAAVRSSLYTWGTIFGYVIALLFIVLLVLSSDRMIRKVGLKWWKRIQRISYLGFILTCLHAFAFQVIEARPLLWVLVVLVITMVIIAGQYMGIRAVRRGRA
jgi:DMSO/TMAO reductase YedYZ heme-binding membrane subunit